MFRPAFRAVASARTIPRTQIGSRFASTSSSRSVSWKGSAIRWAAAGAILYYYNTSSVFAEEPQYAIHGPLATPHEPETYQSVHSIAEQRRAEARSSLQQSQSPVRTTTLDSASAEDKVAVAGAGELEEEAEQQGAFNEETGEINWDCSCLGGMAYGPCGEQFRAAFSCFVYSKEEPKGVDCIEHFKTMQNCFREHPEVYGSELDEDEVDSQLEAQNLEGDAATSSEPQPVSASALSLSSEHTNRSGEPETRQHAQASAEQVRIQKTPVVDADSAVPTA